MIHIDALECYLSISTGLVVDVEGVAALVAGLGPAHPLGGKLLSCGQCQELGQRANSAPGWFFVFRQPISSSRLALGPNS